MENQTENIAELSKRYQIILLLIWLHRQKSLIDYSSPFSHVMPVIIYGFCIVYELLMVIIHLIVWNTSKKLSREKLDGLDQLIYHQYWVVKWESNHFAFNSASCLFISDQLVLELLLTVLASSCISILCS